MSPPDNANGKQQEKCDMSDFSLTKPANRDAVVNISDTDLILDVIDGKKHMRMRSSSEMLSVKPANTDVVVNMPDTEANIHGTGKCL